MAIMDPVEYQSIVQICDMVRVMGSEVVVAGFRPGVVSALITLGVDTDRVKAAMDLDHAFEQLEASGANDATTHSEAGKYDGPGETASVRDAALDDLQAPFPYGDAFSDSE